MRRVEINVNKGLESAAWKAIAALERAEHHVSGKEKSDAAMALRLALHQAAEPEERFISAGGSPDLKLFGTPTIMGTAARMLVFVDPSVPENTVVVKDDLGRELGRIINIGSDGSQPQHGEGKI
jgi:hypothetical protein